MAPSWITIVYIFQNGSLSERWKRASQIRRCAVELIGKNSVTPSTIPRMTDRRKSFTILVLVIGYLLSVISYQLSVVSYRVAEAQPFTRLPSSVLCPLSSILYPVVLLSGRLVVPQSAHTKRATIKSKRARTI